MLGHLNNHGEKTTESNNLNYSYSECESEWAAAALPKDNNAVSPLSVNTTSSKIKLPGNKLSRMNHNKILFLRSNSIHSEANQTPKNEIDTSQKVNLTA